jgi:hypothetical protein
MLRALDHRHHGNTGWKLPSEARFSYFGNSHLVEPDIVPEEGIKVEFLVSSIESATSVNIAAKDMDDTMLNFFGHLEEIHIIPAAGGALDLQFVTVVLIEPLEALDKQEVHR